MYPHLWGFKYANKLLENLKAQGWQVPAASTYSERKKLLLGSVIVAVKALCGFGFKPTRVHLDSKMVPTSEYASANGVKHFCFSELALGYNKLLKATLSRCHQLSKLVKAPFLEEGGF